MSRKCAITGKKTTFGNTRSHAENKSRRTFRPNIQTTTLYSEALGCNIKVKLTPAGLRTLDHKGGIDAYIADTAKTKLDESLRPYKAKIEKALAKASA
ncbi:MAG: 50S ribosomal protein L28 [Alphaproteobacteria bacterium]|nr:50S ribosomal protein L28 [Alphaproteobacteria bacterium]